MNYIKDFFKNILVVETASVLAGPAAGMFFAELGAEVIKIENPQTNGDVTRSWKLPSENNAVNLSAYFSSVNWGKKSIALDLKSKHGNTIAKKIISHADIFIENFLPGEEKKYGLDYKTLAKENPKLIYIQITAFGKDDKRPGFDAILQAETGFMGMNGTPETDPLKMPVALIDILLAHQIKEAALLALLERTQTGRGTFITSSLFQSGVVSLANQASNYLAANEIPKRKGSDHPNISPYGTVFKTKDKKEIVIAAGTEKQFINLCAVLNVPQLAHDKRFSKNHLRVKYNEELKTELRKEFIKFNCEEITVKLKSAGVPCGMVRNIKEVFEIDSAKQLIYEGEKNSGVKIRGLSSISFQLNNFMKEKNILSPPNYNEHEKEIIERFVK